MAKRVKSGSGSARSARVVRYAVVGLGHIAQVAVLPAFEHARSNSRLVALVSDDRRKLRALARQYRVEHTWDYEQLEAGLRGGQVDALYIALPNHLHAEYALRAARAGVHVLCEKPLALSVPDCLRMIRACEQHRVKLMTAYRLHFERANLKAIDLVRSGRIGRPRVFDAVFTMQVKDPENIRLRRKAGGGPLWDIGIYCINAARYLFQAEPEEVLACTVGSRTGRFAEVEEAAAAVLRFPDERLASFTCSFGAADTSVYRIVGTTGDLRVEPAFEYADELRHVLTVGGRKREQVYARRDQFGPELVYFSDCILGHVDPEPSGREGLADVRVIQAIYESARIGCAVRLSGFEKRRRPSLEQEIHRPPVKKRKTIRARAPH
jgi:glucose-fructose oxidoreductase